MRVDLGGVSFKLFGLSAPSLNLCLHSWGPFAQLSESQRAPGQAPTGSQVDLVSEDRQAEVELHFHEGPAPPRLSLDYVRGRDVEIALSAQRDGQLVADSWIDGSFGSIEATLQVVLQWTLSQRGGLLVHAAAGVFEGRGWLIPGVSGAGKSTAAREGGFDQVLSDEMVIVRPVSDSSGAYQLDSTPFWSEGRSAPLVVTSAPLTLIAFPRKAGRASLSPCPAPEAVSALLRAVTCYERAQRDALEQQAALFETACRVVEVTPRRLLNFPKFGPWRASLVSQEPRD